MSDTSLAPLPASPTDPVPGSPVRETPPAHYADWQKNIWYRRRQFDVPALLSLLGHCGYLDEQIQFRSHRTTIHQPSLIHDLSFTPLDGNEAPLAIITVNVGLLGNQSPLPSFFFRFMDTLQQSTMEDFLSYFDHLLLKSRFQAARPELAPDIFPDWRRQIQDCVWLARPGCSSTLHWIFRRAFPELQVAVVRRRERRELNTDWVRLGATILGQGAAMGGYADLPTWGVEVLLHADEVNTGQGRPWVRDAIQRLRSRVFPLTRNLELFLTVILELPRPDPNWLRLGAHSFAGYDPHDPLSSGGDARLGEDPLFGPANGYSNRSDRSDRSDLADGPEADDAEVVESEWRLGNDEEEDLDSSVWRRLTIYDDWVPSRSSP